MNTRPTILTVLIYGALFAICFGEPLRAKAAQATNPPYLAEFPTVQRVKAELKGSDSMDTAARQMGAFWQLGQVIKKLAGTRYYRGATLDENRLIGQYGVAYGALQQYYASYPDRPKWYQMHAFYETDDAFLDQLFQQFFSAEFRAGYYRTTGKQLPQARRSEPAAPGGRASTGQSAVAAGASPAEVNRELGHKEFEAGQKFDGSRNEAAAAQSFKRALEYYKAAIALDPNVTGVYARLGHCYFKAKQYQLALSMWKNFRAQQPDNVAVLPDMSRAHRALNQYQQALPLVQEGIQRKPGKIYLLMLYAELGRVYHGLREYEKALAAYQEVIRIDPFFTNHLSIGDANYELQRYPEAAESYTRAIGVFSNNVDAHYGLGLTYMRMGKKAEALGVYKKLLGIDPKRAQQLLAEINKGTSPQSDGAKQPDSKTSSSPAQSGANTKPSQPAAGPKNEQQKTTSVCCFSASELAALQAKAERGDLSAQKTLAEHYDYKLKTAEFGEADDADLANHLKWLRKAAQSGDAESQNKLGFYYESGVRAPKNVVEGRKWLTKAANQGLAVAANNLCDSLTEPLGVTKGLDAKQFPPPPVNADLQTMTEILSWCSKGAKAGMPGSTYTLGVLYARGIGDMKPNYEEAYFWLKVRTYGDRPFKTAVGTQLTPEKRTEIEARARAWKPTTTSPTTKP